MMSASMKALVALFAASCLASACPAIAGTSADTELDALFAKAATSPPLLRVLLTKLPKGADLHNHAGGGTYAEDFIAWAAAADGCFSRSTQSLVSAPCAGEANADRVALKGLPERDPDLYSDIVDALSTRRFEQGVGDPEISGHRRFFRTFGRSGRGGGEDRGVRIQAEALRQAALDNTLYLELMAGSSASRAVVQASAAIPWSDPWVQTADGSPPQRLDARILQARLDQLKPAIAKATPAAVAEADANDKAIVALNRCETAKPEPACDVTLRYLLSISRQRPPEVVFGQMAAAFALVKADPRYVGINILEPEDGPVSLRDYRLHMRLFAFFKTLYPDVPLTLHAGELAMGLTPPRDLRFHIAEAVEIAGARRIGHGVDIAYEDDAEKLLARMARDKIAVEINLTSNDVILGVKGKDHPLPLYLAAGVPVTLSTDDLGVSRSDLTHEYMRAVLEQGVRYGQLKQMSRDSLTYSFLQGASLWDGPCADASGPTPSGPCAAVLKTSPKARDQWRLERAFDTFETQMKAIVPKLAP
ncbi:adenosine deaminase [Caulobacter sp. 602-1]|uniref:adenosine deaminase family protein n=1 Tax=Caulobacter sp. 602-1 TaxID=2492472 RepID=UPI000F631700|nr:adenosine deaminase [Caulobacter sp. 602-1]RRN66169.1 adenosine deaminase [Caulobacter sp. 602-1]